jgi:hypothetical protein
MFFIFGMPRSGTTLLAQCLSAHSDIVVPHETDFIIPMAFIFDRIKDENVGRDLICKLIVNSAGFNNSLGEYIEGQTVHEIIYSCDYHPASILNALYEKIAQAANAKLAGDKSPNDLSYIHMLAQTGGLSPDKKIIHIVRDIRDVMVSLHDTDWGSAIGLRFPRVWSNLNLYLNTSYGGDKSRYTLIRYEDFVSDPENELDKACRFLGVEFQQEMLSSENYHKRYKGVKHHSNLYNPISTSSVGRYINILDQEMQKKYILLAREALIAFGYISE